MTLFSADYVPPTPEKMEQYTFGDAAAVAILADASKNSPVPNQQRQKTPQLAPHAVPTAAEATQTSRSSTSHGPPTPEVSDKFSLVDEARRLQHEDRCVGTRLSNGSAFWHCAGIVVGVHMCFTFYIWNCV